MIYSTPQGVNNKHVFLFMYFDIPLVLCKPIISVAKIQTLTPCCVSKRLYLIAIYQSYNQTNITLFWCQIPEKGTQFCKQCYIYTKLHVIYCVDSYCRQILYSIEVWVWNCNKLIAPTVRESNQCPILTVHSISGLIYDIKTQNMMKTIVNLSVILSKKIHKTFANFIYDIKDLSFISKPKKSFHFSIKY